MPIAPPPKERVQAVVDAYHANKNMLEVARQLGMSYNTMREWIRAADRWHGIKVVKHDHNPTIQEITEAYEGDIPDIAPRVVPKYRRIGPVKGPVSALVIGDRHKDPRVPDDHIDEIIGRHAARTRPDVILSIGDFGDYHGASTHEREDTYKARGKPTLEQDNEAVRRALEIINAQLPDDYKPRKHITYGNHEHRLERLEDANPPMRNLLTGARDTIFESFGWTHQGYGHWTVIGGVLFTHAPMSIMGRPLGGKNVENTIANDSKYSVVFGHTHRFNVVRRAKQGYGEGVTICNVGCAMPEKYVPAYATALPTGYTYGLVDMLLEDGEILSANLRTFRELERLYGVKAAA